jgi:hypothetical protein
MPLSVVRALRALVVVAVLVALTPTSPVSAIPIEGFPSYQPQTRCSPAPKPGTVLLAEHLLARYPGSGSSGISRDCASSGISEHKEGRAFDWALDVSSGRDRGYAQDFLQRLFATDPRGNTKALARRMGIMYAIWNDRIWSASTGYERRDYLHPACASPEGCSETLRHRDHMHISLTRAGARAETSWYLQRASAADRAAERARERAEARAEARREARQALAEARARERAEARAAARAARAAARREARARERARARRQARAEARARARDGVFEPDERSFLKVRVPVSGGAMRTDFKLRKGATYTITAAGLYTFGSPHQVGDAVCTWSSRDKAWRSRPTRAVAREHGRLALVIDGKRLFGSSCRPGSHTYRARFTAPATRPLRLGVLGRHSRSTGTLTVVLSRRGNDVSPALPKYPGLAPAPKPVGSQPGGYGLLAETVTVPAKGGTRTVGGLQAGAAYRLTVAGVAELGNGVRSNGQCVFVRGGWYRRASIDLRVPGDDHGNLYVNGVPFEGRTSIPGDEGCTTHTHSMEMTADQAGRIHLDLWDPLDRSDNTGSLSVRVQRLTAIPEPTRAHRARPRPRSPRWSTVRDSFGLSSSAADGATSTMRVRKGEVVQVWVTGTQTSHGREADASCVRTSAGWVPRDPEHQLSQDVLDVWVDGSPVRWRVAGGRGRCSTGEHRYTTRFTATKNGPLRLAVLDLDHRDNRGTFTVSLRRR